MFKRELKRLSALPLLLAAAALTVFLARGWVKLSFLPQDKYLREPAPTNETEAEHTPETTAAPSVSEASDEQNENGTTETTLPSNATQTEKPEQSDATVTVGASVRYLMAKPEKNVTGFKFEDAAALRKDGYAITNAGYTDGMKLASVTTPFKITNNYTSTDKTVRQAVVSQITDHADKTVSYTDKTVPRLCLEPYMGYIIYDYKGTLYLLDHDGTTLFKLPDGFEPAYTRDKTGRALFYAYDENGAKRYYVVSEDKKSFNEANYLELTDGRGLYFDYPAYYGVSDDGSYTAASIVGDSATFGYFDASGRPLTGFRYRAAYNFSEGYGAVVDNDGNSYFVGRSGYASFTYTRSYTNSSHRYVVSNFLPPLTNGIESLGFFRFDHGLARIRDRVIDHYSYYYLGGEIYVVTDEDYLVRTDGTRFELPEGFTLCGYSDGVALLESDADGRYGYYDYTGAWIAQPIYTVAEPFIEGLAVLGFDGAVGVIDTSGTVVVPFAYESVSNASSGVLTCYSATDGWVVVNKMAR